MGVWRPIVLRSPLLYKYTFSRFYSASKMSSNLLIEDSKYSWLKELDLKSDNPGVFWGEWGGSGEVIA